MTEEDARKEMNKVAETANLMLGMICHSVEGLNGQEKARLVFAGASMCLAKACAKHMKPVPENLDSALLTLKDIIKDYCKAEWKEKAQ